jgi:hypothetical protein
MNNNNMKLKKSKNKTVKNSMKIIPSSVRNIIIKNHKKLANVINDEKNTDNNSINNIDSNNIGGNVSNNVIYINFNINHQPNISEKSYCNKHQNKPTKTDRVTIQKNSKKSIYTGGNTINNITNIYNNNNSFIKKLGINMGKYLSPANSAKRFKNINSGSKKLLQKIDKNPLKGSYKMHIVSKNKKNNHFNENSKRNINNKNMYNSMKDINDLKNKTTMIYSPGIKNLRSAEMKSSQEKISSLNKSIKEMKIKNREMTNSYSLKDSLINDFKKENSLSKDRNSINKRNIISQKINNINHYIIKRAILNDQSPNDNKNNILLNNMNNSSSIPNIAKDKINKNSRAYINNYSSNNINLSVNKSKTFLNEKKALKEIKQIKQIF